MNDDRFLDTLRDRFDEAHSATPGAAAPPPGLWNGILAHHNEGRSRAMNATMSSDAIRISPAPRSRQATRINEQRRPVLRFSYGAAAALLVLTILGGVFIAGQAGPGGGDRWDLRYAAQPLTPEASPLANRVCDIEPLTQEEVVAMVRDPEAWIREASDGEVARSPWPVNVGSNIGTMIFAQPGIGREPGDAELEGMQAVVDTYLACWASGSMPQIWALMDPHRIRDQVIQSGGPIYSDDEINFRVGQMMDNPARWLIPDPSFDPDQISVNATTDPDRTRIHDMDEVTIGYIGTDTFNTEGELVQSSDWLDNRSMPFDEHDLLQSSFGTVTLLKYPGVDGWLVHDVIVGEVDWSGLEALTPEASPAVGLPGTDADMSHSCPVTFQAGNLDEPPMGWGSYETAYGGDGLRVTLPTGGSLVAPEKLVNKDGEIWDKFLFWSVTGSDGANLEVTGRRLDADAPPLRVEGAPPPGAMAVILYFPTTGCWEVTGTLGDESVTFVMLVTRVYEVPGGEATPGAE